MYHIFLNFISFQLVYKRDTELLVSAAQQGGSTKSIRASPPREPATPVVFTQPQTAVCVLASCPSALYFCRVLCPCPFSVPHPPFPCRVREFILFVPIPVLQVGSSVPSF